MALYLNIKKEDGTEKRIPAINRETLEINDSIESVEVEKTVVVNREALDERRYRGTDIRYSIQALAEGDRIRVSTYPDSYRDEEAVVTKQLGDQVEVENDDGKELILVARFWGRNNQGDGLPWLRTGDGWDSRGEIEEVEVLSMDG